MFMRPPHDRKAQCTPEESGGGIREKAFGEKDDTVVGTDSDSTTGGRLTRTASFPTVSFPTVVLLFDMAVAIGSAHTP